MGYFLFGVIGSMDSNIIMLSTVIVIAFLITAEMITGILEYTVSDSPIYNKMLLKIYKELMFLGIVSFILLMIESSQNNKSTFFKQTLIGVDYCHIMLFYVAIFFVLHVIYLLVVAARSSRTYRVFQKESITSVIADGKKKLTRCLAKFCFRHHFLPSTIRSTIEFKIVSILFADSYSLPDDFNFAAYVKGCFEYYALKTVDVGIFSWMVVVLLFVANYARIKLDGAFNCDDSIHTYGNPYFQSRRHLAGTSNSNLVSNPISENAMSSICYIRATTIFLLCGFVSIIFTFILYYITKYQWLKLIQKGGVKGPDDYLDFLIFHENEKKKQDTSALLAASMSSRATIVETGNFKVTTAMLKKNIEELLDENESVPNDEIVLYKNIFNFFKSLKIWSIEKFHELVSYLTNRKEKLRKARANRLVLSHTTERTNEDESEHKAKNLKNRLSTISKKKSFGMTKLPDSSNEARSPSPVPSPVDFPSETLVKDVIVKRGFAGSIVRFSQLNISSFFAKDRHITQERLIGMQMGLKRDIEKKKISKIGGFADGRPIETKKKNSKMLEKNSSASGKRKSVIAVNTFNVSPVQLYRQKREREANAMKLAMKLDTPFLKMMHYVEETLAYINSKVSQLCNRRVDVEDSVDDSMDSIFIFGMKNAYFRFVEIGIMFNCLYASIWSTFFLSITNSQLEYHHTVVYNVLMIIPFVILVPLYGEITKIASLLSAITDLDLEVIHKCIKDVEETEKIVSEFRSKIKTKLELIKLGEGGIRTSLELLRDTFDECDEDGSKSIDRVEFRKLLRFLHLSFSDRKFNMLYNFVDIDGDNTLQINEIEELIFSKEELDKEKDLLKQKYRSEKDGQSDSDLDSDENDKEGVPIKEYQKKTEILNGTSPDDDNDSDEDDENK